MQPDWALLERWRAGDARAGSQLLKRYFGMLSRLFFNKVSSSEDAADLVSETLLACTKNKARVNQAGSFRAYLTSIAMNQLRMYYRKKTKRRRERDDFLGCCVAELDACPSPSSLLARRREGMLLIQGLRSIPLEYQLVLELNLFEGLNGREIGEHLGVSTNTAHTRLRRGRERLAAAIERLSANPAEFRSTMTDLEGWARQVRAQIGAVDAG